VQEASYTTTVFILCAGVTSIFLPPIANVYGRRPIYLTLTVIAIMSRFATAVSQTWTQVIAARVLDGIGASAGSALGAATVTDLYFMHERGFRMGIYTVQSF
jgi:MFS family permease